MHRKFMLLTLIAVTIFALGACSSLNQVTPSELDNEAMEADVRAKIAEDNANRAFEIGVSVNNGVVTLTGTVDSQAARTRIGNAARDVDGVRSVINNLRVQ